MFSPWEWMMQREHQRKPQGIFKMRDGAEAARKAHNLEVGSSNLPPATRKSFSIYNSTIIEPTPVGVATRTTFCQFFIECFEVIHNCGWLLFY